VEFVRLADVPGPDPFSEGQLLGLELATELRALALRVNQAGGIQITTWNLSKDFLFPPRLRVSLGCSAPRPVQKNRLRIAKTDTFSDQKRLNFGAAACSKHDSRTCAEQNHLREKIGKVAKTKNRVQPGSAPHGIASL
jgi:hypothetical protein